MRRLGTVAASGLLIALALSGCGDKAANSDTDSANPVVSAPAAPSYLVAEPDPDGLCVPGKTARVVTAIGPLRVTAHGDVTVQSVEITDNSMLRLVGVQAAPVTQFGDGGAIEGWPLKQKNLSKQSSAAALKDLVGLTIPDGETMAVSFGIQVAQGQKMTSLTIGYADSTGTSKTLNAPVNFKVGNPNCS